MRLLSICKAAVYHKEHAAAIPGPKARPHFFNIFYQLDLRTPGSSPRRAMFRKQIRQMPNWRIKACGRPQIGQRLYLRVLNLGSRLALILRARRAMSYSTYFLKGMPS